MSSDIARGVIAKLREEIKDLEWMNGILMHDKEVVDMICMNGWSVRFIGSSEDLKMVSLECPRLSWVVEENEYPSKVLGTGSTVREAVWSVIKKNQKDEQRHTKNRRRA